MQLYITVGLLIVTVVMLISDRVPYLAVAMAILATLTLAGVLKPGEMMSRLSDPTMMLFVGTFLISAAFQKVGLTEAIGEKAMNFSRKYIKSESVIVLVISLTTAAASILLQALGVQAAMMTLVITLADQLGISRKRTLIALGYSATIGGTFTLLGNNLDLLARSTYEAARPGESFGVFEMTPLTVPMGILLIVFFCFIGMYVIKAEPGVRRSSNDVRFRADYNKREQYTVLFSALFFVVAVAIDSRYMPSNVAVIIMAFILGGSRIMSIEEMLENINWKIILFAVGITTLSGAIPKVGLDKIIGDLAQNVLGQMVSLRMVVALMFIFTMCLTQLMSNSGSFAIMAPIGIALSGNLGLPLKPIIIAMCLAGSCAYVTPMATPSYAMLASAGNIKFREFVLAGMPMMCINAVIAIVFIPVLF
ncbi:hypothetical protein GPL15_18210 [Clostridium sp. MCC353]|uniref:SLC13 family permease n=1 Tax=Clostridium sp. MCC353 TaxID=2592646 RepID=UPI001C026209|nr:SLC13 family permease [Clostridium sp. MCC353]MBT9778435.1 hypothetical protein [Clostridium sp. MCC353]